MQRIFQQLFIDGMHKANIGIFIIDSTMKILYTNEYISRYLGYSSVELLSMSLAEINPNFFDSTNFTALKNTYNAPFETTHRAKDGSLISVEVAISFHEIDHQEYRIALIQDIRNRKEREDTLSLFHDMLDGSHDMIFILRINDGYIDYVNATASRMLGYSLEELREMGIEGFRRPLKEGEPFYRHLQELKQIGKLTDYAVLIKKDGSQIPIEANVRYLHRGGVDYNIAIVRDISDRIDAERRLETLNRSLKQTVYEQTGELQKNIAFLHGYKLALDAGNIVSKSDLSGRITYVNEKFCEVSQFTQEELIGRGHSIVRHPDNHSSVFQSLWETIESKQMWQGIIKNRKKNGEHYWVDMTIVPIINEEGQIVEYIAVRHEVTELIEHQERLEKVLTTDALTNYGNRHQLMKDIFQREKPILALINIDNFREINDFYGHDFGDLLIIEVANTISSLLQDRVAKTFYRLDGDEFAILGKSISNEPLANLQKHLLI